MRTLLALAAIILSTETRACELKYVISSDDEVLIKPLNFTNISFSVPKNRTPGASCFIIRSTDIDLMGITCRADDSKMMFLVPFDKKRGATLYVHGKFQISVTCE